MKIGMDLGGSHVGIGLVNGKEIIDIKEKIFTPEEKNDIKTYLFDIIDSLIQELLCCNNLKIEEIELIGMASPGIISNGVIEKAGNLGIKNFDIKTKLQEMYQIPIQVRNDGKCAALAEKVYGAMKDYDDCLFLNIGTGIGGAVFLGGKLLEPKKSSGFELGHMVIEKDGIECTCGKRGCFERYGSIKALKMRITKTLGIEDSNISGKYLREVILKNHPEETKQDVEEYLEYLKIGICNFIDIFEPEVICFGGSFSYYEGYPLYEKLIEKIYMKDSTFNEKDKPKIVTAQLKNNAGILGATI